MIYEQYMDSILSWMYEGITTFTKQCLVINVNLGILQSKIVHYKKSHRCKRSNL
ncbi:hypothetical protein IFVP18_C2100024 [Vibrio parahaemolyticus]